MVPSRRGNSDSIFHLLVQIFMSMACRPDMASSEMEKAEARSECLGSSFTIGQGSPHISQNPEPLGEGERSSFRLTVRVEQV